MNRPVIVGALLFAAIARAEEKPPVVVIRGFVDGYYAWNSNSPDTHESWVPGAGTTAKRADEFNLNLAAVEFVRDAAPVGFHLSLVAGTGADVVHAAESEGVRHIYQASVIYKPAARLTLEAGVFPSHIGFEGFFSKDNWSYTRGWLAEFSPYYQTGIHATVQFSDEWSGEVHILNGWQVIDDNNGAKAVGGRIAYSTDRFSASLNTFDGPELPHDDHHWRHFGDLIALYRATPRLSVGGSFDRGHQQLPGGGANWLGMAVYGRCALGDHDAIAIRVERFRDPDNGISGTAQTLIEGTVTYEHRPVPNLILKLEARRDRSTASVFDGNRTQTLVAGGAVVTF
jgi:hypothetical protein